jgi:hypothetical protein
VTNAHLDGSTELAEVFGTWNRILSGQAEWLAWQSRWAPSKASAGQDHWRIAGPIGVLNVTGNRPAVWQQCFSGKR